MSSSSDTFWALQQGQVALTSTVPDPMQCHFTPKARITLQDILTSQAQQRLKASEVSMDSELQETLKRNFGECLCCVGTYGDPTTNPCSTCLSYSICIHCMTELIETEQKRIEQEEAQATYSVSCPACRSRIDIHALGVTNLEVHVWKAVSGGNISAEKLAESRAELEKKKMKLIAEVNKRLRDPNARRWEHVSDGIQMYVEDTNDPDYVLVD
ncbi:hypothetical protein GGX14DRAFT_387800 [Mycena pura]|uniref:RING-type domain-containing protein n=1 Tax=Mycena pura TaxID=153505 RepID=A0AAD6YM90_9AGAR|nr:hypothetical protein GGX14DRAFT_387800 [Mycena pura]